MALSGPADECLGWVQMACWFCAPGLFGVKRGLQPVRGPNRSGLVKSAAWLDLNGVSVCDVQARSSSWGGVGWDGRISSDAQQIIGWCVVEGGAVGGGCRPFPLSRCSCWLGGMIFQNYFS